MNTVIDNNVESVREKLLNRSTVGVNKYGTTTDRTDLSKHDWLVHLQEELMDAIVYIEAALKPDECAAPGSFDSAEALADWLESLHEADGPAVMPHKWEPAQRAARAIREAAPSPQPAARRVTDEDVERACGAAAIAAGEDGWPGDRAKYEIADCRTYMRAALESFAQPQSVPDGGNAGVPAEGVSGE